jgi:HEAT repeat protein
MRVWLVLLLAVGSASCQRPAVVKTALHGDLPTLKREIASERERGELNPGRVKALARAVAGREIRGAAGDVGVRRLDQVEPCAAELTRVLRVRSRQEDEVAAAARGVLFEQGQLDRGRLVRHYAEAADPAWRALAARAATTRDDGALRRALLVDVDARVRRGAAKAAQDARDPADLEPLIEASRLDPDPLVRVRALRGVGQLGGERAVGALVDRYASVEERERLAVLAALAHPASLRAGGERWLVRVLEKDVGLAGLTAARLLQQAPVPQPVSSAAQARLLRAVADGSTEERRFATDSLPARDAAARAAFERVRKDPDPRVRVRVLARLLEVQDATARQELGELAKTQEDFGLEARAALAAVGDSAIVPLLAQQLEKGSSREREQAALGFVELGAWDRAAVALADDDPAVRTRVACRLLAAER